MSLPLLGVSEQGQRTPLVPSSPSIDSVCDKDSELKERYYLGLSDCSSVDSSVGLSLPKENKNHINLKATELRLGLPGSRSPERNSDIFLSQGKHDEKPLFPLVPMKDGICSSSQKHVISGNKREFCDTMDGISEVKSSVYAQKNWMFHAGGAESESRQSAGQGNYAGNSAVNVMVSSRPSGTQSATMKDLPQKAFQERSGTANGSKLNQTGASIKSSSVPAVKLVQMMEIY
uniref:Auxin-responsive protein n=1 Tax=Rhizophora mucronata TaxID=61149 RepID=A0A2P2PAS5_RHIMU